MKRWLSAFFAVALVLALLLPTGAAQTGEGYDPKADWMAYVLTVDENGVTREGTPPPTQFTDAGFGVVSTEGSLRYALSMAKPLASENGFYLEVEVSKLSLESLLVISAWDEPRIAPGNSTNGGGWYIVIQLDDDSRLYGFHMLVDGAEGKSLFTTIDMGNTDTAEDTRTVSVEMRNNNLWINGKAMEGGGEIVRFLKNRPGDHLYVGATVIADEEIAEASPITLTRFGATKDAAYVPGTVPPPVETVSDGEGQDSSDVTIEPDSPAPEESFVTEPATATDTVSEVAGSPTLPGPTDATTEKPMETTEKELPTVPETTNELDMFLDLYERAGGCMSVAGSTTLVFLAIVAGGVYVLSKKRECIHN